MKNSKFLLGLAAMLLAVAALAVVMTGCPNTTNDLLVVNAATPVITAQPAGAEYPVGGSSPAALSVTATVSDGGVLSYQWYKNTGNSNSGGTAVGSATDASYVPTVTEAAYYYVVVTNTNNSVNGTKTAAATSNAAAVRVCVTVDGLEAYLGTLAAGTETEPNTVVLSSSTTIDTSDEDGTDGVWATINDVTTSAEKYVILDLSACTAAGNSISGVGSHSPSGNDMNIIKDNTYIKGIVLPDTLSSIGNNAFFGCTSLTSVTIPDGVESIGEYAFASCTSLTSITVDAGNVYYSSEDGVLFNKSQTTLIHYPAGKTAAEYTIPSGVTSIGTDAFDACSGLTSVTIPDGVESIGQDAFYACSDLGSVTIPDGVKSIGANAFYGCFSLTSVTIPDGVESISEYAFSDCFSLTSVTIPGSVESIGQNAFYGCSGLTSVTFAGSNIADGSFGSNAFPQGENGGGNSLKTAYSSGKAGTYTRASGGDTWTKQGT